MKIFLKFENLKKKGKENDKRHIRFEFCREQIERVKQDLQNGIKRKDLKQFTLIDLNLKSILLSLSQEEIGARK